MTPQTLKLLVMFLLAAALLNVTNYLFYWLYDPPSRQAMRLEVRLSEHTKIMRLMTKRRVTHSAKWSALLLCDNKNSSKVVEDKKVSGTPEYDTRDPNSDSSAFYYYNGNKKGDKLCPETPPELGPAKPYQISYPLEAEILHTLLKPGGINEETECVPRESVAFIIIHREPEKELLQFINTMHLFLMKQQLEYQLFVVKQSNNSTPLNLGKLFNVGFTEANGMKKNGKWRCLVFHDHNIVPTDTRNLYRCSNHPLQLVDQIENRLIQANFTTAKTSFGTYQRVNSDEMNETRNHQPMPTSSPLNLLDGLSTLVYTLNKIDLKPLYTLIDVDIDKPQFNSSSMWEMLLSQVTTAGTTVKSLI